VPTRQQISQFPNRGKLCVIKMTWAPVRTTLMGCCALCHPRKSPNAGDKSEQDGTVTARRPYQHPQPQETRSDGLTRCPPPRCEISGPGGGRFPRRREPDRDLEAPCAVVWHGVLLAGSASCRSSARQLRELSRSGPRIGIGPITELPQGSLFRGAAAPEC
jgi:hypothetical protein